MKKGIFSPRVLALFLACAIAMFALSILLHAYDISPVGTGSKAKPGSYSVSSIGYAGLYDTLRRLDFPVLRSAANPLAQTGARGTLILAEPDRYRLSSGDTSLFMSAPRMLLVLPKWKGTQNPKRPTWVSKVEPLPLDEPLQTLTLVTARGTVIRKEWPQNWSVNETGVLPSGSGTVQLINSKAMRPVIGDEDGMLVGELMQGDQKIWVLADPDLMSNHGIGKGDNVACMIALLDGLRFWNNSDPRAPLVFDETLHGFQSPQGSVIKLLFRFPFVVVTLLVCACAALLALSGTGRFGVPQKPAPALDFGKAGLIGNGARLLDYAGHHGSVLKRYIRMTVRLAAHSLHAPPGLDEPALAAWLDKIGEARGVRESCSSILQATAKLDPQNAGTLPELFGNAWKIYCWKGEILNGSATTRRHS